MQHRWSDVATSEAMPSVDDLAFKKLYTKETYDVLTNDGWSLVITRYKPTPQAFPQPLRDVPILCVHGFCQNRHTWTCGEFVKNLLFFGADVHLLELRGHGKSGIKHQHERLASDGLPLPRDLDYGWNLDSYLLQDVPAAIQAVKEKSGRDRIAYIGHSMGGMIGYGVASMRDDLSCLVTIGSPAELGKDFRSLRWLSRLSPLLSFGLDSALALANVGLSGYERLRKVSPEKPLRFKYKYVPMDWLFGALRTALSDKSYGLYARLSPYGVFLFNPRHTGLDGVRWLLKQGTDREARGVIEQFARWIRNQEMVVYKTGYDIHKHFADVELPLAIIFGDRDALANVKSTRKIYYEAKSEYLLWRPVRGNSHIELTMGHDIRQICYDIKNIVEYAEHALAHRRRSLPRLQKPN